MRYRTAGTTAAIGLLLGGLAGSELNFPPFLQILLRNPLAYAAVCVIALATVAGLIQWSREPAQPQRPAFVAAMLAGGILEFTANLVAPAMRWWRGPLMNTTRIPSALLYALNVMLYMGLLLLLYRWQAAPRPWRARLLYVGFLLCMIPVTVLSDQLLLRTRLLRFGAGYSIWKDVLLGVSVFAVPPVLYELICRRKKLPL